MNDQEMRGVWLGLSGYVLWGLSPIFWKALGRVEALDILSWRIICTFIFSICCHQVLRYRKIKTEQNISLLKNTNGHKSSHKASQSMPILYYCGKLRTLEVASNRSTENLYEARKNEEKLMSKRPTVITRAARHA